MDSSGLQPQPAGLKSYPSTSHTKVQNHSNTVVSLMKPLKQAFYFTVCDCHIFISNTLVWGSDTSAWQFDNWGSQSSLYSARQGIATTGFSRKSINILFCSKVKVLSLPLHRLGSTSGEGRYFILLHYLQLCFMLKSGLKTSQAWMQQHGNTGFTV